MKFQAKRTSLYGGEESPHERAIWNESEKQWEIKIKSIKELLELGEEVIIEPANKYRKLPRLEFYDDYRE